MNIKKAKKIMLKEKEETLLRYKITEEYLIKRISEGEESKREELIIVQDDIREFENLIEFLRK